MMRTNVVRSLAAAVLVGAPLAAGAQAIELEPGSWKLHVTSTTNGTADPAQDMLECLRAEELKDLGAYFAPQLEGVEAECQKTREPSTDPRKLDYWMQCKGSGFSLDATTSVTIETAQRFRATLRIETKSEPESALVVAEFEATRTGACEQPAPSAPGP